MWQVVCLFCSSCAVGRRASDAGRLPLWLPLPLPPRGSGKPAAGSIARFAAWYASYRARCMQINSSQMSYMIASDFARCKQYSNSMLTSCCDPNNKFPFRAGAAALQRCWQRSHSMGLMQTCGPPIAARDLLRAPTFGGPGELLGGPKPAPTCWEIWVARTKTD